MRARRHPAEHRVRGAGSQLAQAVKFIHAHKRQIAFITLDIGANDVDGCVTNGTQINGTCLTAGIDTIKTNVPVSVSAFRKAAGKHAEIAGMTYYDPFLADYLNGSSGQALAGEMVALANDINQDLSSAFQAQNVRVADVATAFGTYTPFTPRRRTRARRSRSRSRTSATGGGCARAPRAGPTSTPTRPATATSRRYLRRR